MASCLLLMLRGPHRLLTGSGDIIKSKSLPPRFSLLWRRGMAHYIGAIDQGTSSTRFMLFDEKGKVFQSAQQEFDLIQPKPGWIEQDPKTLLSTVLSTMETVMKKSGVKPEQIKGVGITNQRETTIVWDKVTGEPLHNAIVWSDVRTAQLVNSLSEKAGGAEKLRNVCGLPLSTYFSAVKLHWLIENVAAVRSAISAGRCLFGTVDTWLMWKLAGVHKTDVTNASRTMLLHLETLQWHQPTLDFFSIPKDILPQVCSSSEDFGTIRHGPLSGVKITGCLGDQQAALVGQGCFEPGSAKSTYGTGTFVLFNTGTKQIASTHGLLTTVAYKLGPHAQVHYALEGSIAVAGLGVKWLRDNIGIIQKASDMDALAGSVEDCGGVYFVPAFSGLFAPHWRSDARGTILGLTQYSTKAHIARALLEAAAFQTTEVLLAMRKDSGLPLARLLVDGGMSQSNLAMQTQSDLLGIPVARPTDVEATARGAAIAAGLHAGLYKLESFRSQPASSTTTFTPQITEQQRSARLDRWQRAIQKSLDWADSRL